MHAPGSELTASQATHGLLPQLSTWVPCILSHFRSVVPEVRLAAAKALTAVIGAAGRTLAPQAGHSDASRGLVATLLRVLLQVVLQRLVLEERAACLDAVTSLWATCSRPPAVGAATVQAAVADDLPSWIAFLSTPNGSVWQLADVDLMAVTTAAGAPVPASILMQGASPRPTVASTPQRLRGVQAIGSMIATWSTSAQQVACGARVAIVQPYRLLT